MSHSHPWVILFLAVLAVRIPTLVTIPIPGQTNVTYFPDPTEPDLGWDGMGMTMAQYCITACPTHSSVLPTYLPDLPTHPDNLPEPKDNLPEPTDNLPEPTDNLTESTENLPLLRFTIQTVQFRPWYQISQI